MASKACLTHPHIGEAMGQWHTSLANYNDCQKKMHHKCPAKTCLSFPACLWKCHVFQLQSAMEFSYPPWNSMVFSWLRLGFPAEKPSLQRRLNDRSFDSDRNAAPLPLPFGVHRPCV